MLDELTHSLQQVQRTVGPGVVSIGSRGRGCGVVVADGLIATNAHNLRGATTTVTFSDGRSELATVRSADPDTDLAVIAVDTGSAPILEWADRAPETGQLVLAVSLSIGAPARVTFGTVSAIDRAFRGPRGRRISGSIEHTAPLPRGSSGSALVDPAGRVYGISTHRLGEGFYLAVPASAELRQRIDALGRGESSGRPQLGVGLAPTGAAGPMRRAVGLPEREGLLVRVVEEGSAADRAGLRPGDLLVSAADRPLRSQDDLYDVLDAHRATTALDVGVVRGSEELRIPVGFNGGTPNA